MARKKIKYAHCPKCQVQHDKNNSYIGQSYCKKCNNENKIMQYSQYKEKCVQYKGGKCEICGYYKCHRALEFHHTDPNKKDFNINPRSSKTSVFTEKVQQELDKCILLCANCHREEHDKHKSVG